MLENVGIALVLSTLAGLSTTLGSLFAIAVRKPGSRFMALALGFSAGVMILVSFMELLADGIEAVGVAPAYVAFFAGMLGIFLIDISVPHQYMAETTGTEETQRGSLLKTGFLVALGVGVHNFPEGMATFAGTLQDVSLGTAIAVAIAIHNIPEGLAISAPVYAATGSRGRAFLWSLLAGVTEPVGAALSALLLLPWLNGTVLGLVLSGVAGIMVFIALDELLPAAQSYGEAHLSIMGVVLGMLVMVGSLWMLH